MATAFFRTVILYLLLIAGLRLSGKRQIGELEPIELVLTLLISDLASVPMQDFALPLFNGVIPIITLIALSTLFSAISLRNVRFRDLVCGQPALVIVDGKLRQETMRRNRLTLDELFEQLRGQGITDLSDVKYAVLETNGRLSVLPRSPLQPVTPEQLGLDVQDNVFLPIILINDGRVLTDNLRQAGRDDRWLGQELHRQGIARSQDVFLLSVDLNILNTFYGQNANSRGTAQAKAVLFFILWNAAWVTDRCGEWTAAVDTVTADLDAGGDGGAALGTLDDLWQDVQGYMHIIVSHEDLDEAEALMAQAKALSAQGSTEELYPVLAQLRHQFRLIAETQQLSPKNIF